MKSVSSLVLCLVLAGCNNIPREGWTPLPEMRADAVPENCAVMFSTGASMLPFFPMRCRIVVRAWDRRPLAVGDIVVYRSDLYDNFTVHRVRDVSRDGTRYYIAGDNSPYAVRGWVAAEKILWVVVGRVRD